MNQRSLVGMTMGARKRAARRWLWPNDNRRDALRRFRVLVAGYPGTRIEYALARKPYRIGQRLRPCPGCADCDPYMGSYGAFYGGDPRRFTPDEECSTEDERALHKAHCDAWNNGARPTVKTSGIEWVDDITYQDSDGNPQTIKAGHKLVERAAYGLGVTRLTNDKRGLYCSGSGVLPATKARVRHGLG